MDPTAIAASLCCTLLCVALMVVAVLAVGFFLFRSGKPKIDGRQIKDESDPLRAWSQVAIRLYSNQIDDPGYWPKAKATQHLQTWSIDDVAGLEELLDDFAGDRTGFDIARRIWLARVGFAQGYVGEGRSWQVAKESQETAQRRFNSWAEYAQDVSQGLVAWHERQGIDLSEKDKKWLSELGMLVGQAENQVPFR